MVGMSLDDGTPDNTASMAQLDMLIEFYKRHVITDRELLDAINAERVACGLPIFDDEQGRGFIDAYVGIVGDTGF